MQVHTNATNVIRSRIWLLSKLDYNGVTIILIHQQITYIALQICLYMFVVYATNYDLKRRVLWELWNHVDSKSHPLGLL